jgi:hypothetical protein
MDYVKDCLLDMHDMCLTLALMQGPDVNEDSQMKKKDPTHEGEDKVPLPLALKEDLVDKVEGLVMSELLYNVEKQMLLLGGGGICMSHHICKRPCACSMHTLPHPGFNEFTINTSTFRASRSVLHNTSHSRYLEKCLKSHT